MAAEGCLLLAKAGKRWEKRLEKQDYLRSVCVLRQRDPHLARILASSEEKRSLKISKRVLKIDSQVCIFILWKLGSSDRFLRPAKALISSKICRPFLDIRGSPFISQVGQIYLAFAGPDWPLETTGILSQQ